MINNLFEKALSVIEDVNRNLQSPVKDRNAFEYDDSYFTLQLEGGPLHTDLLIVHANIKQGERADEDVPLRCKWFVTQIQDELMEIQGLSAASYRPCVDDVGNRILVQAIPRLDGTYIGMPIFKEVGPLKLDPELEKRAYQELEKKTCEIKVIIEAIYFDYEFKAIPLPCKGTIILDKEEGITITALDSERKSHKLASCKYSEKYPTVQIQRSSQTSFEVHLDQIESLKLSVANHWERDMAAIIIRMFNKVNKVEEKKQEIQKQENAQTPEKTIKVVETSSFEDTMRIDKLTDLLKQTEKEKLYYKSTLEVEQKKRQKFESENQEIKSQLETLKKENEIKTEELTELYQVKDKLSAEKLFFLQEKNLYKSQISELEETIQNLEAQINELSLPDPSIAKYEEEKKADEEKISELKRAINLLEDKYEQVKSENDELKKKVILHQTEKEDLESTINSLQKKTQSLIQECGRLNSEKGNPPPSSSIWSFPMSPLLANSQSKNNLEFDKNSDTKSPTKLFNEPKSGFGSPIKIFSEPRKDELTLLKERVESYEEDLKQLRAKNTKLTITLETMKVAQDTNKGPKRGLLNFVVGSVGSGGKNNGQDSEYLHKLVNTLTETITEKDFILDNTKRVNKELGKRIHELEMQLAQLTK